MIRGYNGLVGGTVSEGHYESNPAAFAPPGHSFETLREHVGSILSNGCGKKGKTFKAQFFAYVTPFVFEEIGTGHAYEAWLS